MACCFIMDSYNQDGCVLQILDATPDVKFELNLALLTMVEQQNGLYLTDGTNGITLTPTDQTNLTLNRTILEGLRTGCV